ncbi:MAG TPA: hypothetical protein VHC46_09270 [Thermodesulfobacteriota bacterium]|nr:hypothetical protein [Candidatus Paceibacterota bacterium]HVY55932.1 hypothetical protein [Thermodesulfobacteriota bacterium]
MKTRVRTIADLGVGPQESVFERAARFVSLRLTAKHKLCLAMVGACIGSYVTLGLVRCAAVALSDDPGIVYIPALDWWWILLFAR